jgi:hypothetical protein
MGGVLVVPDASVSREHTSSAAAPPSNRAEMIEATLSGYFPEQRFAMLGCHDIP